MSESVFKPMLASDYEPELLKFPLWGMPKIDGVRALGRHAKFIGRSLKAHPNRHTQRRFGAMEFDGFDGEAIVGTDPFLPRLCHETGSAIGTVDGEPVVSWWLFDFVKEDCLHLTYRARYAELQRRLGALLLARPDYGPLLRAVPYREVDSLDELRALEAGFIAAGYEGIILRDPEAVHKQGRSTAHEGGFLRGKPWIDWEMRITGFIEGRTNQNEAKKNALGRTERSTHAANMKPNGLIGTLVGVALNGPHAGQTVHASTGTMTMADAKHYFAHPDQLVGRLGRMKSMAYGVKDKPRFASFQCFRNEEDMS